MDCLLEEYEPVVSVQFICKRHKQKMLIDALLQCSRLSLEGIATILKVSCNLVSKVHKGSHYLKPKKALQLAELFLICFMD